MDIQTICNYIVLASAVIIAVKNIYGFFHKPITDFKGKNYQDEEKHIKEIIAEEIDKAVKSINETTDEKIEELKEIVLDQGVQLKNICQAQQDTLRQKLGEIYYEYLPYRKIRTTDWKIFEQLYTDYKALNGNGWLAKICKQMENWTVVEDAYEFTEKDLVGNCNECNN